MKKYILNVNKWNLYELAKLLYPKIEPVEDTAYYESLLSTHYYLDFNAGKEYHNLEFLFEAGHAYILDRIENLYYEYFDFTFDELLKYHLVKQV